MRLSEEHHDELNAARVYLSGRKPKSKPLFFGERGTNEQNLSRESSKETIQDQIRKSKRFHSCGTREAPQARGVRILDSRRYRLQKPAECFLTNSTKDASALTSVALHQLVHDLCLDRILDGQHLADTVSFLAVESQDVVISELHRWTLVYDSACPS